MGGPDGSFNGRWRFLDGLRQWYDPHDLVVIFGAMLASALLTLAFVFAVFASSVWVRQGSLEERLNRIESAMYRQAVGEQDGGLRNATAAGE